MKAFLARDYGIDPDLQNLCDGLPKSPCVRSTLRYSSAERRLERAVIRELLRNPESKLVVLDAGCLRRVLGNSWEEVVISLGRPGLSRVSLLVCEACVRVSVRFSESKIIAEVY